MMYFNSDNEKKEAVKAYAVVTYSDKGGYGEETIYTTAEEALEAGKSRWESLTHNDKKRYLKDAAACFYVAEGLAVDNDGELEGAYDERGAAVGFSGEAVVLWDALKEEGER